AGRVVSGPHRVRRRPVHGGQLPGRGRAVPDVRQGEDPDARRAGHLGGAARPVGRHGGGVPDGPGGRRGPGGTAVRQLGRLPVAGRVPAVGAAGHPPGVGGRDPAGGADHPVRGGHRRAPPPDGLGGIRRGRDRLAGPPGRGPAAGRPAAGGAGQPRPGGLPGPLASGGGGDPPGPAVGRRRAGAHLQPGPRRAAGDRPRHPDGGGRPGPRRGPGRCRRGRCRRNRRRHMTTGVLVMAHGTPATPEEIEPFYTRIRRGRPPTPEQLADLRRRYDAIGGTSPLAARTAAQVAGLAARLDAARPGEFVVRYGAKHTAPFIEDTAAELAADGVDRVVGLVLTPHRSSMGSGEYLDRAAAALEQVAPGLPFIPVRQWYDAAGFAELMAGRVLAALSSLPSPPDDRAGGGRAGGDRVVVFTAHSLPERVVAAGDPYPDQLADSARAVAEAAGLHDAGPRGGGVRWRVAWQSAGRTPDPWLGPDVLDVIRALPAEGAVAVVVCPVGFVADHLEVLFDLDVEARAAADAVGVAFARTASLNDDAGFLDLLADVVTRAADAGPRPPDRSGARRRPTVAVIGGGVAGLAAAWELTGGAGGAGAGPVGPLSPPVPGPLAPQVVVLEAATGLGGKVRAEPFGGRPVDLGPDGFLGRRPEAAALCREIGLGDDLRPIGASGAAVWADGRRRTLPAGQVMGVPTRFWPVARSGILGWRGNFRLLMDVVAPRPDLRGKLGDRAIGPLVANKLGRRVVRRLVDPLIGGIYAGTVDDVSAATAFPLLLAVSQRRGSLMRSLRRAAAAEAARSDAAAEAAKSGTAADPPPAFWSLAGGVGSLVDRLAEVVAGRGATIRTDCPVH